MSVLGLNTAEQEQVTSMIAALSAVQGMTVEQLAKATSIDVDTLATDLNAKSTDKLTASMLKNAIASGTLTSEELEAITALGAYRVAVNGANADTLTFTQTLKSAMGVMASNPLMWIALAISLISTLIPLVSDLFDSLNTSTEEYAEICEDVESELTDLNTELSETQTQIEELESKESLTLVEQEELEKLREANDLLEAQVRLKEKEQTEAATENICDGGA